MSFGNFLRLDIRGALAADDRGLLHKALEDGVAAKAQFGKGLK